LQACKRKRKKKKKEKNQMKLTFRIDKISSGTMSGSAEQLSPYSEMKSKDDCSRAVICFC
jgi:hypothetical protein